MNIFKKIIHTYSTAFIVISSIIVFAYWNLPETFFQQDEWVSFSNNIFLINKGIIGVIESILPVDPLSHFTPLARAFSWFEYMSYGTTFIFYAWESIFLHIINTFLLYYFVLSWLKNKKIAIISALVFGVNSIPSQSVTWVAVASSEITIGFILLSLIFFHLFLAQEVRKKAYLVFSLIALFISLLFHENGIFLFLFYPIIFLLDVKPKSKKILKIFFASILAVIAIFAFIRLPFFFGFSNALPEPTDIFHPPIAVFPYRAISISLKSFAGSLVPEKTLIKISDNVVRLSYPQFITADNVPNPYVSQTIVFDLVSYLLTIFIVVIIFFFMRFSIIIIRKEKLLDAFRWVLIFVPASLLPCSLVLGRAGYASIIEPRFFYVGSIGISILVAIVFHTLIRKFSEQKILKIAIVIIFGLYLSSHIYAIRSNVNNLVVMGARIKIFLNETKKSYQKLPQTIVFFTQSDTAYYGMPDNEKMLPTQIGFGKMLMVWYQKEERFPDCLYQDQFLLKLLEEGYRYCGGRGFGYFRDYEKLVKSIQANNVPMGNIIAYSWQGKKEEFKNITNEIRVQLRKDLSNESSR